MTVGEKIKQVRKSAGLTQKELGERLGVSYQTVAQWENNLRNPKQETLQRIASALNVSTRSLQESAKSTDTDFKLVQEYLGLTETALYTLTNGIATFPGADYPYNDKRTLVDVLNSVLSDSTNFLTMLAFIRIATTPMPIGYAFWGKDPSASRLSLPDSSEYTALACEYLRKIIESVSRQALDERIENLLEVDGIISTLESAAAKAEAVKDIKKFIEFTQSKYMQQGYADATPVPMPTGKATAPEPPPEPPKNAE